MYQYTAFDRAFVHQRAAQFRDQLERNLAGTLGDDEFRPLRLQNGWYIQRHAPMARIAVPYGELSSRQLRQLARIAREFDRGYAHFTTRQNCQYNWIPLPKSADVMDLLADVDMHGIQTSGNCIRNITSDALAGVAPDEIVDPRPYCEILRQWSSLHPEFAFLPRKFKIAVSGAAEDRAATYWHDIGLHLLKNEAGEVGFRVLAGGGMGRTPIPGVVVRDFLPWQQILCFIEAIVRVYNRYGRRDNMYKARIKILVKAEGQKFIDAVNKEFEAILNLDTDGDAHIVPQAELDRVAAGFVLPAGVAAHRSHGDGAPDDAPLAYRKWLERNVHGHKLAGYKAVTLSLKRTGQAPGDVTDAQMEAAADLADRHSCGELRVTHDQNLLLPWVREEDLYALWQAARANSFATPNIGLLTDMIACPGGDFCALANARSIPIAAAINERFDDLDELYDIGDIDLHMSGCINSCGHHHSGHIGILGVDKDGKEWYQVSLGGTDGSTLSGGLDKVQAGKVIGPSFAAEEVPDVMEALIDTYRHQRAANEHFIDTVRRVGIEPFKSAANAVRRATAKGGRVMQFIDAFKDEWRTVGGEDGPMVTITPAPKRLLTLLQWRGVRNTWPADVPVGVSVPNDAAIEDLADDLPRIALVALDFPKWTDGRAYSQARLLRARYRYAGAVRATGEVVVDMMPLLARTGFDQVVLRPNEDREAAERALRFFPGHYQADVREHRPLFALPAEEAAALVKDQPEGFVNAGAAI